MRNDFRNEGNGFPYEHRPLADQGASEALKNGTDKGFIREFPEPAKRLSDYDRLKDVLYAFGHAGHEHMTPDRFFEERGFPDLAHVIREGRRDFGNAIGAETALREQIARVVPDFDVVFVEACVSANTPPPDHTAQAPFTEEEIAAVWNIARSWRVSMFTVAAKLRSTNPLENPFTGLYSAAEIARYAAIAEHLAKTEGE